MKLLSHTPATVRLALAAQEAQDIARILRQAIDSDPIIHGVEPLEKIASLAEKFEALHNDPAPEGQIVLTPDEFWDAAMSILAINTQGLDGYFPELAKFISDERLDALDHAIFAIKDQIAGRRAG